MPRKTFTAGEVLAAADVNEYLMDQSVMTFADSAARGSAIPSPTEGMVTYLDDTDTLEVFNGTSFTGVGGAATTNAIINGAFEINQRGFTSSTAGTYGFDRFASVHADGTVTYSAEAFTAGTAPIAGYEAKNFARIVTSGQTLANAQGRIFQAIEDVRTFAGQAVTISFFAKAGSGTPEMAIELNQDFGTGGSPSAAVANLAGKVTLSTSWTRYSLTLTLPSLSGKTIGTTTPGGVFLQMWASAGTDFNARTDTLGIQSNTFDIWGVQVEAGSTATPFKRNANSLQGELAACQRYYHRTQISAGATNPPLSPVGFAQSTTQLRVSIPYKVTMRRPISSVDFSALQILDGASGYAITAVTIPATASLDYADLIFTSSGLTQFRPGFINTATTGFIGLNAEF
jgi:hypothetical protein